jgi:aryl-alcohol dehydrogenase-like predicted oxidoreductase
MNDLVKTGKIRYWGVVNWQIEKVEEAYQAGALLGAGAIISRCRRHHRD